ncbi:MAG: hypothetical protein MUO24_03565 [Desulfobacterales bacterium]|nr:hypothetical protein [Desulfobacterales bacterium]
MNPFTPWLDPEDPGEKIRRDAERIQHELEKILGYPAGAFAPGSTFHQDAQRINKALGQGFVMFQALVNPQQLKEKFEDLVGRPVHGINLIGARYTGPHKPFSSDGTGR